jgi:hypothetical protein
MAVEEEEEEDQERENGDEEPLGDRERGGGERTVEARGPVVPDRCGSAEELGRNWSPEIARGPPARSIGCEELLEQRGDEATGAARKKKCGEELPRGRAASFIGAWWEAKWRTWATNSRIYCATTSPTPPNSYQQRTRHDAHYRKGSGGGIDVTIRGDTAVHPSEPVKSGARPEAAETPVRPSRSRTSSPNPACVLPARRRCLQHL